MGLFEFLALMLMFFWKTYIDFTAISKEYKLDEIDKKYVFSQIAKIAINIWACINFLEMFVG